MGIIQSFSQPFVSLCSNSAPFACFSHHLQHVATHQFISSFINLLPSNHLENFILFFISAPLHPYILWSSSPSTHILLCSASIKSLSTFHIVTFIWYLASSSTIIISDIFLTNHALLIFGLNLMLRLT